MPQLGDIKLDKHSNRYVYHACVGCGKERWVLTIKGLPCSIRCLKCAQALPSYRLHISEANKGRVPYNKGISPSNETRQKMGKYKSFFGKVR